MIYAATSPSLPALPKTKPAEVTEEKVRHAPRYKVLIHNDDVTTFDFVFEILTGIFRKDPLEAREIMLTAHKTGLALVGIFGLEEAEFRVDQAQSKARTAKFPLKFTIEPDA